MFVLTFVFLLCCMIGDSVSNNDLLWYATTPSARNMNVPIIMHAGCRLNNVSDLSWAYIVTMQITAVANVMV